MGQLSIGHPRVSRLRENLIDTHGETDYSRQARNKARKDTSGYNEHDNARRAYQKQRAEAFSRALANVRPGVIVVPEFPPHFAPRTGNPFANTPPGPGNLAKAPPYNDMIASSHPVQAHEHYSAAQPATAAPVGHYPPHTTAYPQQMQHAHAGWAQQGTPPSLAQSTAAVGTYSASTQMYASGMPQQQQQGAIFSSPPPSFPGFAQAQGAPAAPQGGQQYYTHQVQVPSPLGQPASSRQPAQPPQHVYREVITQKAPGTPSPAPPAPQATAQWSKD